jgi:hypothetical protein
MKKYFVKCAIVCIIFSFNSSLKLKAQCTGSTITTAVQQISQDGPNTTTFPIDLSSLSLPVGASVLISNLQARGDMDGQNNSDPSDDELFTLVVNSGAPDTNLTVSTPSNNFECDVAFRPTTTAVNLTRQLVDIGGGVPGIIIDITIPEPFDNHCSPTGGIINDESTPGLFALEFTLDVCAIADPCDASASNNLDTDGDNVSDICDLDDDNDGILDAEETGTALSVSGNTADYTTSDSQSGTLNIGGQNVNISIESPEIIEDTGAVIDLSSGVNGSFTVTLDFTSPISALTLNFGDFDALPDESLDNFNILPSSVTGGLSLSSGQVTSSADNNDNGVINWTGLSTSTITFDFNSDGSSAVFRITDMAFTLSADIDTDNDGIVDRLDLDSDNDGIPDIVEAGGTDLNNDGEVDNFTDANDDGFGDTIAASPLPDTNSDTDALPNRLDLDADNDGIPDNIEAQTTGGYLAPSLSDTATDFLNNRGFYSNYFGGFTPVDTEGDGTPDYLDSDSDNDGITDLDESFVLNNPPTGLPGDNGLIDGAELNDDWSDVNGLAFESGSFGLLDTGNLVQTNGIDYDYRRIDAGEQLFGTRIISSLENGTVVPNKIDAYLNIVANNWGVVITRVNGVGSINNAVEGMIVFDTSDDTFKVCTDDTVSPAIWRAFRE